MSENTIPNAPVEKKKSKLLSIVIILVLVGGLGYFGVPYFCGLKSNSAAIDSIAVALAADSVKHAAFVDSVANVKADTVVSVPVAVAVDSVKTKK